MLKILGKFKIFLGDNEGQTFWGRGTLGVSPISGLSILHFVRSYGL